MTPGFDAIAGGTLDLLAWESIQGEVAWILVRNRTTGVVVKIAPTSAWPAFASLTFDVATVTLPPRETAACPTGYTLTRLPGTDTAGEPMDKD